MKIVVQEMDSSIQEAVIEQHGDWVREEGCLVEGPGCCRIAAVDTDSGQVAGFAALRPARWIAPLEQETDGFIEVIEVGKAYRRQGIGRALVERLEKFAAEYGYYQIRAWSSCDKVEALHMWRRLQYCMCPAVMLGQSVRKEFAQQPIVGYYYAKLLNPDA